MAELALRMVVSLAVVVGLLLLIARLGARRFSGRAGAAVQVLHRQQLGRGSALTVVTVGGRTLVLGTTEQQVRVLAELDADEAATVAGQDGAPLDPGTGTTDGDREDVTTRSPRLATVTALPSLSVVPAPADESEPATEQPEQTSRTDLGDPVDHRSEGPQQQGTAVTVVTDDAAPVPSAPTFPAAPAVAAVLPALGEQPGPYAGHAAAILGRLAPAGASAGVGPRPTDEAAVGTAAEPAHDLTGGLTGDLTAPDAAVDAGSLAAAAVSGRHRSDHPALTGPAPAAAFEPVRPDPTAPRVVARHRVTTTAPALGAAATPVAPALAAAADVPAVVPAVLPAAGPEVVPAPPLGATAPATVSGLPAAAAVAVPAVNPAELLLAQETATDATTTTGTPLETAGTATAASTPGPATAAPAADDFAAQLAAWLADPTPLTPTATDATDATGTATTGATPGTEAPAAGPGRATRAERRTARGLVRRARRTVPEPAATPAVPATRAPGPAPTPAPARPAARSTAPATPTTSGPLAGSVLSPQTWRQALAAVSGRAS